MVIDHVAEAKRLLAKAEKYGTQRNPQRCLELATVHMLIAIHDELRAASERTKPHADPERSAGGSA